LIYVPVGEFPTRRSFIKLGALSLAALAFRNFIPGSRLTSPAESASPGMTGRVTRRTVEVFAQPDAGSQVVRKIQRDQLVNLLEQVVSPQGPSHNPRWYRLPDGFIHSAHIQRVENAHSNDPITSVPEGGQLGEVTVPFTITAYKNRRGEWMDLYRLYYQSVHWITAVEESPQGYPWCRLTDERLKVHYYIPAAHIRPIQPEELAPIAAHVPDRIKRIEVSIEGQFLTAFEGSQPVFEAQVSTGKRYMETPEGKFQVERKYPSRHMGDGGLTRDLHAYELVGVPWVTFFHPAGIAFHGTFWHDNFGTPMSQGCVNMRNEDAKWLFRWCSPFFNPVVKDRKGWKLFDLGTVVEVI
jgi:lipoprotein-anchoring transpeptidase ErfK/SrfK